MTDNEKIIWYLTFAKSKLDNKSESHKEAKEEINELIQKLKSKE